MRTNQVFDGEHVTGTARARVADLHLRVAGVDHPEVADAGWFLAGRDVNHRQEHGRTLVRPYPCRGWEYGGTWWASGGPRRM
jgi:hypothetical protein